MATIDEINAIYGKLPPQAIETEEAVIGMYMIEANAILENAIQPEWFYKDDHRIIAQAIVDISKEGKAIDLVTVVQRLREKGELDEIGGPMYIAKLHSKVASAANIKQHIDVIKEKWMRREYIRLAAEVSNMAYNEDKDLSDILKRLNSGSLEVMGYEQDSVHDFKYATEMLWKHIEAKETHGDITGIPTGFKQLNEFTGGWQGTDLVVIAGESSQGKTSLALRFTTNATLSGIPGAYYSLEMSLLQLTGRIVSSYSDVSSKKILFQKLTTYEKSYVENGIYKLQDIPLYTDDNVNNSLESIVMSIRRLHIKYGIKFAVIDYIQNLKEIRGKNEEAAAAEIVKTLKNLAKELDITIFALSQLSRNKEKPFPTINRLRGSGQIEETADIVIMIYRPEYYGIAKFPEPFSEASVEDAAMLIIGKGRNIGTGAFLAEFIAKTTTFRDFDRGGTEEEIEQQQLF